MKEEDKAGETEESDFDCLWDEEVLIHTSDSVGELVVQAHFILSFTLNASTLLDFANTIFMRFYLLFSSSIGI